MEFVDSGKFHKKRKKHLTSSPSCYIIYYGLSAGATMAARRNNEIPKGKEAYD